MPEAPRVKPETTAAAIRERLLANAEVLEALAGHCCRTHVDEESIRECSYCQQLVEVVAIAVSGSQREGDQGLLDAPEGVGASALEPLPETAISAADLLDAQARQQARLRELATSWRARYQASLDYDRKHGLRDVTTELGGMVNAADELDAVLESAKADPAVATPSE